MIKRIISTTVILFSLSALLFTSCSPRATDLQAQLEGTENRINVSRQRFSDTVNEYNTYRRGFPTILIAGMLGFNNKEYFKAQAGSEKAPEVKF